MYFQKDEALQQAELVAVAVGKRYAEMKRVPDKDILIEVAPARGGVACGKKFKIKQ